MCICLDYFPLSLVKDWGLSWGLRCFGWGLRCLDRIINTCLTFEKTTKKTSGNEERRNKKNITQQNLLSLRKRKSTTFNPGPTPSLPSLIPTEVKVQSGKCRQEHRDPSAPGSQSKVTVSPWLQLLQTLLIPSSSTLKKLYSRLELLLCLISSTQLSFIG